MAMWGIKLWVIEYAESISGVLSDFCELVGGFFAVLADFLANFTFVSILFEIWPYGVSNHRFLGMLNPFLRSYPIFYIWLADFFLFLLCSRIFLANFTFVSILFEIWP